MATTFENAEGETYQVGDRILSDGQIEIIADISVVVEKGVKGNIVTTYASGTSRCTPFIVDVAEIKRKDTKQKRDASWRNN